jgi:hypothetical protein
VAGILSNLWALLVAERRGPWRAGPDCGALQRPFESGQGMDRLAGFVGWEPTLSSHTYRYRSTSFLVGGEIRRRRRWVLLVPICIETVVVVGPQLALSHFFYLWACGLIEWR